MYRTGDFGGRLGPSRSPVGEDVVGTIADRAGPLPQIRLEYDQELRILWLTIQPEPKPVFTLQVLRSVVAVQRSVAEIWAGQYDRCPVRFLAFRGEGAVFTLGGDLDFYLDCLASNDRVALRDYAQISVDGACFNMTGLGGLAITISTVHAKAMGGGIDAPRSCHLMIGEEEASFSYPEVKFNHFPITAVGVLSRHMGDAEAKRMLLSGDEYGASEFHRRGGLDAVVAQGRGQDWIRSYARETLPMHAARLALFSAFQRRAGDPRPELEYLADLWTTCMLRMAPTDIAKLQRVARTQERMLSRMYRDTQPATSAIA